MSDEGRPTKRPRVKKVDVRALRVEIPFSLPSEIRINGQRVCIIKTREDCGFAVCGNVFTKFYLCEDQFHQECRNYVDLQSLLPPDAPVALLTNAKSGDLFARGDWVGALGQPCIEGCDLAQFKGDPHSLVPGLANVADCLSQLHAHNVAHGDLALQNLMFDGERVILVDFGELKRRGEPRTALIGNPEFCGPEINFRAQEDVDHMAADVYAFGAILLRLFCGRFGYPRQTLWTHAAEKTLKKLYPNKPAAILDIIENTFLADPADRWGMGRVAISLSNTLEL